MQKNNVSWGAGALLVLLSLVLLWTVPASADNHMKTADVPKTVYVCGCCNTVADQPGEAPCGMTLVEKQVLKEDADKIYVCACGPDCKCGLNAADPTKCACNKELRAYPKKPMGGCAHGMAPGGGGCDKPCCAKPPCEKPCCAKPQAEAK